MQNKLDIPDRDKVDKAVNEGVKAYIDNRRQLIPEFVDQHYSFKGAWQLNKKALGWDLAKAPANVVWAPIYLLTNLGKKGSDKLGWDKTTSLLDRVPAGFRTDVESEVEWLVYSEFLHLPIKQANRENTKNLLMEFILNHPEVRDWIGDRLSSINDIAKLSENRVKMEEKLLHYVDSRKAAAEITAALIAASASFVTQKSLSVGALGIGQSAAAAIAYHSAVSSFAFGSSLGSVYYTVFPASVSTGLFVTVTGGIAAALGVIAAFGGIIADPVQRKLGLHQKKLDKLLNSIECQFESREGDYNLKDQYVARVLDLVDILAIIAVRS